MNEVSIDKLCTSCEKSVLKIERIYKDKKYCSTCYARIFKKKPCASCGELARLPKNDEQAICTTCIKKQACVRCKKTDRPIGKITEYGVVCNSCSVYFRPVEHCERCSAPSQRLTRISRFNDGLRVCPKCSIRDYETCPSCHKYRLLETDEAGTKICKKCRDNPQKKCEQCHVMIAAGSSISCDECYWHKNLWLKLKNNQNLFENNYLKEQFEQYACWLEHEVGAHKAALYINKHVHFFIKTELLWIHSSPTAEQLLAVLRTSGLRKFELVIYWLHEAHLIKIDLAKKDICSEQDQMDTLIASLPYPSIAYDVVSAYKSKLEIKINDNQTSMRSARLAIKPAVTLMQSTSPDGATLPNLQHVKDYLIKYPGQSAALTGFINFLNEKFNTSINYLSLKKSRFLDIKRQQKLENEITALAQNSLNNTQDIMNWVKNGLMYFHNLTYPDISGVKYEMIKEDEDGLIILLNEHSYWLPKIK